MPSPPLPIGAVSNFSAMASEDACAKYSTAIGQSYLAVYEPVAAASVEVSAHFKLVGGTAHHAGGIALRLLSPDDYYLVRADPADEDVRLYRVVAGNRREIKQVSTEVAPDQWHTLDVRVEQGRFEVSLDGKSLFTANDQTSSDSGKGCTLD